MTMLADGKVRLRTPVAVDASALAAAVQASLDQLLPWMPWASANYDEAAARLWIGGRESHPFVMIDTDGDIVGACSLDVVDVINRRANLGYWVRTDRCGQGIATAATALLATYGFETVGLQRLEIIMSVHNEGSRRVAERAGAAYEGILRHRLYLHGEAQDAHSYSLVK
jgi:ribosomal-protein-serine acetyltransferase